ncbi:hypothetical protein GQ457_12G031050 [Hibiscus cannabinus]
METGRQAYLTYVMNPIMREATPRDIRTVCDFWEYFRNSCLVLPPDREVEFVIETQTDSAPVSISPYRRSPKELKELKTQLQELLDRGFIRLSTSTWGTPTDLRFGYYQLKVKEQDVLKTAFRTNGCFLIKRLRKCVKFEWSDARQQAFEKLKEALTNAPVLIQPVSERELYMRQRRWLELLKDYDLRLSTIRRAPVCWAETRQKLSPLVDILKGTTEKVKLICDQLKIASDRQKSYVDLKCREIEYVVGDRVFLKVSPWKKVMRFGRKGKLSPRYIGPYEIVERVGSVAYRLLLPPELERIHDVFHVSMLRKYRSDPSHVMPVEEIELNPDLSYDEEPVEILASDSKVLRGRTIELVKVKWRHRGVEEATWERKEDMMEQFPYLFPSGDIDLVALNEVLEAPHARDDDMMIDFTSHALWYGYIYLMHHKSEALEKFKEFKNEVHNQHAKSIKALRSDRGGEYLSQDFDELLKECGIVSQLTPPGTPQWN